MARAGSSTWHPAHVTWAALPPLPRPIPAPGLPFTHLPSYYYLQSPSQAIIKWPTTLRRRSCSNKKCSETFSATWGCENTRFWPPSFGINVVKTTKAFPGKVTLWGNNVTGSVHFFSYFPVASRSNCSAITDTGGRFHAVRGTVPRRFI